MDDNDYRKRSGNGLDTASNVISTGVSKYQEARAVIAAAGIFSPTTWAIIIGGLLVAVVLFSLVFLLPGGEAAGIPEGTGQTQSGSVSSGSGYYPQTKLPDGSYLPITLSPSQESCVSKYEPLGPCSVNDLMPYFENNRNKAITASLICNAESKGNPDVRTNDTCSTNDYSIGLFQINAVANCSINGVNAYSNTASCNSTINYAIRSQCERDWKISAANIRMAYSLSSRGTYWGLWGTWDSSNGNSPAVGSILTQCGISF